MNIEEITQKKVAIKLNAIQALIDNSSYTKEDIKGIIDYNLSEGKLTSEDVKGLLRQVEPVIETIEEGVIAE